MAILLNAVYPLLASARGEFCKLKLFACKRVTQNFALGYKPCYRAKNYTAIKKEKIMKKRIFCLLLAVLMLVGVAGVFTSCGGTKDPGDCTHVDANKDNKCDECGETMTAKCSHEDADEDGKCDKCGKSMSDIIDDVVEYPWADDEPVQLLFQMSKASNFQNLSSMCQRYLAGEDPYAIEEIDTMVADRNAAAAIETNINVTYQYYEDTEEYEWGKTIDLMYTDVNSGSSKIPDMYCNFTYDLVGASLKGTFANLKSHNYNYQGANYFEFLEDGWYQEYDADGYSVGYMYEYMQSTTLNEDKMYILASDYFIDLIRAFFVVPVHIGLLEANGAGITGDLDGDGKFTIEDFYQEVRDRKWTYNKVIEYGAKVYDDTNNDGAKNFGDTLALALTTGVAPCGAIYTTTVEVIEWSEEDDGYVYPTESPALYDLFDQLKNLVAQPGISFIDSNTLGSESNTLAVRTEFCENRVLFGNIILVGSLEYQGYQQLKDAAGFGVVPVPLYHEVEEGSDENYLTSMHNIARPGAISSATKKFAECTAFLNYQSEFRGKKDDIDSNDILTQYYNFKLQYDVADGSAGTVEMLRYIRSNVRSAFDKTFEDAIGVNFNIYNELWATMLASSGYSMDIRPQYGEYATRKTGHLKTLTGLFNSNELPG